MVNAEQVIEQLDNYLLGLDLADNIPDYNEALEALFYIQAKVIDYQMFKAQKNTNV